MSEFPGSAMAAHAAEDQPQTRGFLHIARHGTGPAAMYVVTYRRLDQEGASPLPVLADGAQSLLELLERIGVDFRSREVRGALTDVLRLGSANIPGLWLSDEQIVEKGLCRELESSLGKQVKGPRERTDLSALSAGGGADDTR
jgi:hypothetical protein